MQQINLKLLNAPEASARERYIALAETACGRARRWAASAVDAGLPGMLRPHDEPLLTSLLEQVRRREILMAAFVADAVALAGVCSDRIRERGLAGWGVETLSAQAVDIYAMAEAVEAVLDLGEALCALERIGFPLAPHTNGRSAG